LVLCMKEKENLSALVLSFSKSFLTNWDNYHHLSRSPKVATSKH
jgi:hypothetical protein